MTGSVGETDATHVEALLRKAFYFVQKPFDRRVLLTLVQRCLDLRRLELDNRRHTERLESELGEARAFQQSLLQPSSARIGAFSIAARTIPSAELGGDFYDYADAGAGRIAVLIADVAGHGASAAMLTGIVKSAFDSSRSEDWHPAGVLRRVADGIRNFEPRRFVTLICARLDARAGIVEWVNAGHPPGLLWLQDAVHELSTTGPLISPVFADRWWKLESRPLQPGARILLFTDGLVELEHHGVPFGTESVRRQFVAQKDGGVALLDGLQASAHEYGGLPAADDVTLLTVTMWAEPRGGGSLVSGASRNA
jgi:sigma-B regulation protein RsbU (phosphoserine phosphatase)